MPLKGIKAINVVMKWRKANKSAQTFPKVKQWNFCPFLIYNNFIWISGQADAFFWCLFVCFVFLTVMPKELSLYHKFALELCFRTLKSVTPYACANAQNPLRGKSLPYANSWWGDVETPAHQMNSNHCCSRGHLEVYKSINRSNTYSPIRLEFPCL